MILLIAAWLAVRRDDAAKVRIAGVLAGLGVVGGAACVFLIVKAGTPAPNTDLSTLLQQNPGDYALSFGHFLDLNAQAMGMFRVPLIVTAVALGFGLPVAFWLRLKGTRHAVAFGDSHLSDDETVAKMGHRDSVGEFQRDSDGRAPVLVTAGAAFVFLLAAHQGLVIFSPTLTSYQLARAIAPQVHAEDLIVLHGEYESGSTLGFYLRRNDLHIVEGRSSNLWYGSFFPDAPRIFETRESIARKWSGAQRIFLWQDPHDRERPVLALPAPVFVLVDSGGKQILSNQPNR
jgi:hypothetical protein